MFKPSTLGEERKLSGWAEKEILDIKGGIYIKRTVDKKKKKNTIS